MYEVYLKLLAGKLHSSLMVLAKAFNESSLLTMKLYVLCNLLSGDFMHRVMMFLFIDYRVH